MSGNSRQRRRLRHTYADEIKWVRVLARMGVQPYKDLVRSLDTWYTPDPTNPSTWTLQRTPTKRDDLRLAEHIHRGRQLGTWPPETKETDDGNTD